VVVGGSTRDLGLDAPHARMEARPVTALPRCASPVAGRRLTVTDPPSDPDPPAVRFGRAVTAA